MPNLVEKLKRLLVRTAAGELLINLRDLVGLWTTSRRHFEDVGGVANDMLMRKLLVLLAEPNMNFLDIGCHLGSVSAAVLRHAPGIHIFAFEAIPQKVENLKRRFPNIQLFEVALGNRSGETTFNVDLEQSGCSSLGAITRPGAAQKQIVVPMRQLDEMPLPARIDLIKIDVEGAEQGVIEGARKLLRNTRPVIFFESGPLDLPELGFSKTGLWHVFKELDYRILVPNRVAHADPGLSLESFLDAHEYPRRTTNYIAIPMERRAEIRTKVRRLLKFED